MPRGQGLGLMGFQSTRPVKDATCVCKEPIRRSNEFQSTRPVKDATGAFKHSVLSFAVSIHASREGRDYIARQDYSKFTGFNPRVP